MTGRLRVLDLTDRAAAYATRLLADLGADVVRIDGPGRDEGRRDAPHRFFNAGKRSAGVDLRGEGGLEVLARLCADSDAVVDGMEPVPGQTGQVYARCRAANPRLTWVAIRPCAPDADAAGLKSAEIVRYALSGLMSITGMPGQAPSLIGGGLADAITATYGSLACLLGCRLARQTGSGRLIWVSAHEALTTLMQQGLYEAAFSGRVVRRGGNRHAHIAMAGALPCRDGHVVISANERRMWSALVEMVGDERLRDEALIDERTRMQRQAEIFQVIEAWTRQFTKAELSEMAQARGIPVAPVHDVGDLRGDPHLRARGFFCQVDRDEIPALLTPWRQPSAPAPDPGEHTRAVLDEAGLSNDEIARLEAAGVVTPAAVPVPQRGAHGPALAGLAPGADLPVLETGPLSLADFVRWAGYQENWIRLHYDPAFARERMGLADAVQSGHHRTALLARTITDWLGSSGWLRRLSVRHIGPVVAGDTVRCGGRIRWLVPGQDGATAFEVDIWAMKQDGERVSDGVALVEVRA